MSNQGGKHPALQAETRRARRMLRMVSELHKRGLQLLRIQTSLAPSGMHWRVEIRPGQYFAYTENEATLSGNADDFAHYSTGDGTQYFGWTDAEADNARALADKFEERFRWMSSMGQGRDWKYAGWYQELLGRCERGFLPVEYADFTLPVGPKEIWLMPADRASDSEGEALPPPPAFEKRNH